MNQEKTLQSQSDEIDLIDFIRVVIKRKKLILGLFLIGLIAGGGLTFVLPKYKTETYLQIGSKGAFGLIEAPLNIVEKINVGFYGNYPRIKAENPEKTNLIKIEIVSRNPRVAKKNLENINKSILSEHNQKIETGREALEKAIKELQEKVNFLISKNQQTGTLMLEISSLQQRINNFWTTQVVKQPVAEKKVNLILNLLSGGVLGIFLGVFLAFGKEWWEKNKGRL